MFQKGLRTLCIPCLIWKHEVNFMEFPEYLRGALVSLWATESNPGCTKSGEVNPSVTI